MARTIQKTRIVGNTGRRAKTRRNVGQIVGFTMAAGNPGRKAGSMAKSKKHHSKKNLGYGKSHYKGNPGHVAHHKKHHYKRNPGMLSGVGPLVTNAVFVIVGALGSKLGAQMVLGSNNVGWVGYAGNAAAGGILWFLADRVMRNKAAAAGILAGTTVQIVLRLLNDYTPFGQYVANLGMGDYQMQSFVTPQILVDPWNSAEIAIPPGWAPRAAAALPAPAGTPAGTPMPVPSGSGGMGGGGGLYGGGGGWGGGLYAV